MASDLTLTLTRISEKSRFLTERFKTVQRQRDEALERVTALEKELRECKHKLQLMTAENEYLKVSSILAPTAESVTATRVMIRELISEIDRCIAQISE